MMEKFGDWIEHDGGPMPVPAITLVLTRRRTSEDKKPETAGWWNGDGSDGDSNWLLSAGDARITHYRVPCKGGIVEKITDKLALCESALEHFLRLDPDWMDGAQWDAAVNEARNALNAAKGDG